MAAPSGEWTDEEPSAVIVHTKAAAFHRARNLLILRARRCYRICSGQSSFLGDRAALERSLAEVGKMNARLVPKKADNRQELVQSRSESPEARQFSPGCNGPENAGRPEMAPLVTTRWRWPEGARNRLDPEPHAESASGGQTNRHSHCFVAGSIVCTGSAVCRPSLPATPCVSSGGGTR